MGRLHLFRPGAVTGSQAHSLIIPGKSRVPAVPFPSAITGLTLRLRADLGVTVTGSGVSQWNDQSGGGRNFVQGTDANRPPVGTGINGRTTLQFNGTSQNMTNASAISTILTASAWTVGTVHRYTGGSTTAGSSFSNPGIFCDAGSNWGVFGTTQNFIAYNFDGADKSARPTESAGTNYYSISQLTGGNVTAGLNGGAPSSTASGNLSSLASSMVLGSNGSAGLFWSGSIGEIVIYNRALTAGEISQLNAYFASFWGI